MHSVLSKLPIIFAKSFGLWQVFSCSYWVFNLNNSIIDDNAMSLVFRRLYSVLCVQLVQEYWVADYIQQSAPFHTRGITIQYLKARDITVIILSKPNISLLRFIIENINTMEHYYRKMLLLQVLVSFDYSK